MIRIGYQTGIKKEYKLDSKFKRNIEEFNKLKIPVGIYFYSKADSKKEAIKQANWIRKNIKKYDVSLPIAFDWENFSDYQYYKLSFYHLTEVADTFMDTLEKYGYDTMLYSNKFCLREYWYPTDHKKWLAYYTDRDSIQEKVTMWQVTDNGRISGISDNTVDIDVFYKE